MKIGVLGLGRMGTQVEALAVQRGHAVTARIDALREEIAETPEVWVDFSDPGALERYLPQIAASKTPVVIGTTNWEARLPDFRALFEAHGVPAIYSSNYSIGVQCFFQIVSRAAALLRTFEREYDVLVSETHHRKKIDAPSGTAKSIVDLVLQNSARKTSWSLEPADAVADESCLHVAVSRIGQVPGTHSVVWDSYADTIEIRHQARNREGFALGAIVCAEHIHKLPPGLHELKEVFPLIFSV